MSRASIRGDADKIARERRSPASDAVGVVGATTLFTDQYAEVLIRCRSVLHDVDLANDAAQETFLQLARFAERSTTAKHDFSWLLKLALGVSQAMVRREALHARLENLAAVRDESDRGCPPFTCACDSELAAKLFREVAELPEGQRTVVHDLQCNVSIRKMVETYGLARSTIETQVLRARETLRAKLRHY